MVQVKVVTLAYSNISFRRGSQCVEYVVAQLERFRLVWQAVPGSNPASVTVKYHKKGMLGVTLLYNTVLYTLKNLRSQRVKFK